MGGSAANGAEQAHLATAIHVGQHVEVLAQCLAPHAGVDPSVLLQTQSRTELPGHHHSWQGPATTSHPTAVSTTEPFSCSDHWMPGTGSQSADSGGGSKQSCLWHFNFSFQG